MNWKEADHQLYRKFEFKDFSEAFAFMTRVALAAELVIFHGGHNTQELRFLEKTIGQLLCIQHQFHKTVGLVNFKILKLHGS